MLRLTPTVNAMNIDCGDGSEHGFVVGSWEPEFIVVMVKNILGSDTWGSYTGREKTDDFASLLQPPLISSVFAKKAA